MHTAHIYTSKHTAFTHVLCAIVQSLCDMCVLAIVHCCNAEQLMHALARHVQRACFDNSGDA
jgi:hypothetical protein